MSSSQSAHSERAAPWYLEPEEVENSPSRAYFTKKYGSAEKAKQKEQEHRLSTCAFLQESGQKLRLPQLSIATAIVFYHRFYARESYEHYERFQVATTCLFLASKVEETPKKLKDVIAETYKVQYGTVIAPEADSSDLWKLKEQIFICEREVLRVLGFDLSVEHAYRPLLAYIKSISGTRDLAQIAWNFINDSLRTTICLQYAPRCLAAAAAHMASKYLECKIQKPCQLPGHPPGSTGKWFSAFQVREATVDAIIAQINEMYTDKGGSAGGTLANSGAVAKMRMHGMGVTRSGASAGAAGAAGAAGSAGASGSPSAGAGADGSAACLNTPAAESANGAGAAAGTAPGGGVAAGAAASGGGNTSEPEEGELEDERGTPSEGGLPPSKRAREAPTGS